MATGNTDLFYSRLPVNRLTLSELLSEEHLFFKVPENWHVLITDVKKSTDAIANGLHETVNLVATGSIVAVLNIAFKANLSVPFFFGGDGATFIVPPVILDPVKKALIHHQQNTSTNFNLDLRVGHVPVADLYAKGQELKLSKLSTSQLFSIPVVIGNGLSFAERIIKGEDYFLATMDTSDETLDLSGMQCRWDRIKPPPDFDEVVSLLVIAREGVSQTSAFREVVNALDRIYGDALHRRPITISRLKLKGTLRKLGNEMKVRLGGYRPLYLIKTWFTTMLGSLYFRTGAGKTYLTQLVEMSDTLVIDGRINTVISGTSSQREELQRALDQLEADGLIRYGLFVSKESIISCYVRNMDEQHVHFVDGAEGGYTRAAIVLKKKMATNVVA